MSACRPMTGSQLTHSPPLRLITVTIDTCTMYDTPACCQFALHTVGDGGDDDDGVPKRQSVRGRKKWKKWKKWKKKKDEVQDQARKKMTILVPDEDENENESEIEIDLFRLIKD